MKRIVRLWVLKRMEIIAARGDSISLDCLLWNIKDIPFNWNIMTLSSWRQLSPLDLLKPFTESQP